MKTLKLFVIVLVLSSILTGCGLFHNRQDNRHNRGDCYSSAESIERFQAA